MKKIRIAYFHQDGLITGSAISLSYCLKELDKSIFEPFVILAEKGPAEKLFNNSGAKTKIFFYERFWTAPGPKLLSRDFLYQLRALKKNKELVRFVKSKIRPDIIHLNDKSSISVGLSFRNMNIPIVQHIRSTYYSTNTIFNSLLNSICIKKYSNKIIVISEDELDFFHNCKNHEIINNSVDFSIINKSKKCRSKMRLKFNIKKNEVLIGFMSNISPKRGIFDFLEIAKFYKKNKNFKFLIVGGFSQNSYLFKEENKKYNMKKIIERFTERHQLKNLNYTGFRNDNLEILSSFDFLIAPNKYGVLGRQPIEAQSMGITCLAYDGHSRKSQIIKDNETGFKLDNLNEIINKIEYLYTNRLINKFSKKAIEHAEKNFCSKANTRKIENIYKNLLNK